MTTLAETGEYDSEMPAVPECLKCGTCCFSLMLDYVRVSGKDYARLGERVDELVWFDGNRAYMRMVEGHCGALRLEVGSGEFVCGTYGTRPQVCRDLARGSGACLGEIATKALRPLSALSKKVPVA
jgi:Fe-S-cluster containining protein